MMRQDSTREEKGLKLFKSGQEHYKAKDYKSAESDLEVCLDFWKLEKAFECLCLCYEKLNKFDKLAKIQEQIDVEFPGSVKFLPIKLKLAEKNGEYYEATEILEKIVNNSNSDSLKVQANKLSYLAKVEFNLLSSSMFIETEDKEKIERLKIERKRVSSCFINSSSREIFTQETMYVAIQFLFLQANLIHLTEDPQHFSESLKDFGTMLDKCPKSLVGGYLIDELMYFIATDILPRCDESERTTLIYKMMGSFKESGLSLFYQLKYIQTSFSAAQKYLESIISNTYQALIYLFYNTFVQDHFRKNIEEYVSAFEPAGQELEMNIHESVFPKLNNQVRQSLRDEFKIRGEIFLMFAQKLQLVRFNKEKYIGMEKLDTNFNTYLAQYDEVATKRESNNEEAILQAKNDVMFQNVLFEVLLLKNHDACKKRTPQVLLSNFKRTISQLDAQHASQMRYLKDLYYQISLRITTDCDQLTQIKNALSMQLKNDPSNTESFKSYYLCNLKLSRNFNQYDPSYTLSDNINRVLHAENQNTFFRAEQLWINFSTAPDKRAFYNPSNQKEFSHLLESSMLEKNTELSALLLKRISILRTLFDANTQETKQSIIEDLQKSTKLNPLDYQAYVCLGLLLHAQGDLQGALDQLQTAFFYYQHDLHLNKMIFYLMMKMNQNSEAIQFLYRIYPGFKQIFWINRILGVHSSNAGDYKNATLYCQRALELYHFDKSRNYKLSYEKKQKIVADQEYEIPYVIDLAESSFKYFNDCLIWSDSVYEQSNFVNISPQIITNPKYRIYVKLCLSLAQADMMQGKTCSSFSAIEEAEKAYFLQTASDSSADVSPAFYERQLFLDEISSVSRNPIAKTGSTREAFECLRVFESIFNVNESAEKMIAAYDLNVEIDSFIDALTINFQFSQISSYLNNLHVCYARIRTFLILCYEAFHRLETSNQPVQHSIVSKLFLQMVGFIMEISLKYARMTWRKYTISAARSLVNLMKGFNLPQLECQSTTIVDIAFAEFYTFSGYLNSDIKELKQALSFVERIFATLSINPNEIILLKKGDSRIELDNPTNRRTSLLKYAMKAYAITYFYLHYFDQENQTAYQNAIACATAGILTFNLDIDFYNFYGLVQKEEKLKIGAFMKSNRIQKNSMALDCLAFIYLKKQRYEEATNMLLKSIEINTKNTTAYIGLFIIQFNMALSYQNVVQTGNDDNTRTFETLRSQMIQKCGSYLHYIKQIEISASSVLFDGLLEYMNYQNERSHITYYFSSDLFDRAPHLANTMLGTLYQMMMLKSNSSASYEKKIEIFKSLKPNLQLNSQILLEKASSLNVQFMQVVEGRIEFTVNELLTFSSSELFETIDSLLRLFKLYLALALYINEAQAAYGFFQKQIEKFNQQETQQNTNEIYNFGIKNYSYDFNTISIQITELEYQLAKSTKNEEGALNSLRRLSNLKKQASPELSTSVAALWPFSNEFTQKVNDIAEFKYLQGVHCYSKKEYALAKKFFFSAVLINPAYKAYLGHYTEYFITQERYNLLNTLYVSPTQAQMVKQQSQQPEAKETFRLSNYQRYEQNLLMTLNSPNFTLKQKINHITKSAMYFDKPMMYYLLVHFSFEDTDNHTFTKIISLMQLLNTKVIKPDPENHFGLLKKSIKLLIEMLEFIKTLQESTQRVFDEATQKTLANLHEIVENNMKNSEKLKEYKNVIQIYYMDSTKHSKEIVARTKVLLEKDRVMAYFLTFNLIRKQFVSKKTRGLINLVSNLNSNIISAVEESAIPERIQKSYKGKLLSNMLQHLDGYSYLLALQEQYREKSKYDTQDILEMIQNNATNAYEGHPMNLSMKLIYAQQLYRQSNLNELTTLLKNLNVQKYFSNESERFIILFYETLLEFARCKTDPSEEFISNFFEKIVELEEEFKNRLSSSISSLLHFMQGLIYLKIAKQKRDFDRTIIRSEFSLAILYSPEHASVISRYLSTQ